VKNPGDAGLHDPDEDIGAETIEITRQAILNAMKKEERRRHEYIERRILTDRARASLANMPLRKAANHGLWAATEQKHAIKAAEAAAAGDKITAPAELEKQQLFHAMTTESFRIRKDRQKFVSRWTRRAALSRLGTVEYKFREPMQDILTHWLIVRSERFRPDSSKPDELTLPIETDGMTTDGGRAMDEDFDTGFPALEKIIPEWIRKKRRPEGYLGINDLTANQMRGLDETLNLLANQSRDARGFFDHRR
jgi:hypothetical protein